MARQRSGRLIRSIACRYYLQNYEEEVAVTDLVHGFLERAVVATFHDCTGRLRLRLRGATPWSSSLQGLRGRRGAGPREGRSAGHAEGPP